MAQVQKYSDELLVSAVRQYAKVTGGKIKATELAKWANENIEGLEGVQAYHFLRTVQEKDRQGKKKDVPRPSAVLIKELNETRKTALAVETNPLINSASLDDFFALPKNMQRSLAMITRNQFDKLREHNYFLAAENEKLRKEYEQALKRIAELEEQLSSAVTADQLAEIEKKNKKTLDLLSARMDEEQRKAALESLGLTDGAFDVERYQKSKTPDEVFSIGKTTTDIINMGVNWDDE